MTDIIDIEENQIYEIFTQMQDELCRGFEACGLEEEQNMKKVLIKLEAQEMSKIGDDIEEISQLDPSSQPAFYPG